jgi:hypothetical protein
MQVVKKVFLILAVIWFAFVVFMPKRHFYYQIEQILSAEDIKINEGKIGEGLFTLSVEDAVVYIKGIDLIHIKRADFFSLLFYSSITLEEVQIDQSLANMTPTRFRHITLSHFIWTPEHVTVSGKGEFGAFEGDIDVIQRKVHLDFTETGELDVLKRQLKKGEKGLYYERSF